MSATDSATATRLLHNYVAGRWMPSSSADPLDVRNPATGERLAHVPMSSAADLDAAVQAAREALPAWRAVSTIARAFLKRPGPRLILRRELSVAHPGASS